MDQLTAAPAMGCIGSEDKVLVPAPSTQASSSIGQYMTAGRFPHYNLCCLLSECRAGPGGAVQAAEHSCCLVPCAGSVLYTVFEAQAWLSLFVGGLLSFNVLFPSDEPDIARLLG